MEPVSHRIATWWMNWEDLNWPNPDNLDRIKARAEQYAQADVSAAMLFGCHFRWDFLPYFTLLHDYIATVAELIIDSSLKRKESRGLHYNADYPFLEPDLECVDTIIQRDVRRM